MATSRSGLWTPVVDDCDWTQVGDPVKRRQIQNRISKRRQRERARQQKLKDKEAAAKNLERMFHDNSVRRNSSATMTSSPTRLDVQSQPRWRGHSSPPGVVSIPDWQPRSDYYYDGAQFATRPGDVYVSGYTSATPSATHSASSSGSAPFSYWTQTPVIPSLPTQFPPTPYTEQSRSPAPFRSPTVSRQTPTSDPITQAQWAPLEMREGSFVSENTLEPRISDNLGDDTVPNLPSTARSVQYSHMEHPQPLPSTTMVSTEERLNTTVTYSQAMGYPSFEPVLADYYNRGSP